MGDLVNLEEYRKMKDEEKNKADEEEIEILKLQLSEIMRDAEEPTVASFFHNVYDSFPSDLLADLNLDGGVIDSYLWNPGYDDER